MQYHRMLSIPWYIHGILLLRLSTMYEIVTGEVPSLNLFSLLDSRERSVPEGCPLPIVASALLASGLHAIDHRLIGHAFSSGVTVTRFAVGWHKTQNTLAEALFEAEDAFAIVKVIVAFAVGLAAGEGWALVVALVVLN